MESLAFEIKRYFTDYLRYNAYLKVSSCVNDDSYTALGIDRNLELAVSVKRGTNKIERNGDVILTVKASDLFLSCSKDEAVKFIEKQLEALPFVSRQQNFGGLSFRLFMNKNLILQSVLVHEYNPESWIRSNKPYDKLNAVMIYYLDEAVTVSDLRCCIIALHIKKLFGLAGITVHQLPASRSTSQLSQQTTQLSSKCTSEESLCYNVTSDCQSTNRGTLVLCSVVADQSGGSKLMIKSDKYIKHLEQELHRASAHKYGDTTNSSWKEFIFCQAKSCQSLQFLSVSHRSVIKVDLSDTSQNTRESAFILYNYARLRTLMNSLQNLIEENLLPAMPARESVDFSLLKHQEEWELCWLYVHRFPELLREILEEFIQHGRNTCQAKDVLPSEQENEFNCQNVTGLSAATDSDVTLNRHIHIGNNDDMPIQNNRSTCLGRKIIPKQFPTHKITKFLHSLSHCVSVYYNRVHILPPVARNASHTKVSPHLLPVLWARIYLLKNIQVVMETCFDSLGINPPAVM